jgi:predicted HAD superfamily Cof-like phosphohydrolase
MTNPFKDQETFMTACDQTVNHYNSDQFELYHSLIAEEFAELNAAVTQGDKDEQLDALIDILVVTIGAIHSMGANGEGAWNEVMRTNFAKIDPITGKVRKREDGKVLKPEGWTPPNLSKFVKWEKV